MDKKYIILEGTRVKNVTIGDVPPGVEGIDYITCSLDTNVSTDNRYDADTDTIVTPLSYNLEYDHSIGDFNGGIYLKGSLELTCSFNRNSDAFSADNLINTNPHITCSNINYSNNNLSFTITTGSAPESGWIENEMIEIEFTKQHADSYGFTWDLRPILLTHKIS